MSAEAVVIILSVLFFLFLGALGLLWAAVWVGRWLWGRVGAWRAGRSGRTGE